MWQELRRLDLLRQIRLLLLNKWERRLVVLNNSGIRLFLVVLNVLEWDVRTL